MTNENGDVIEAEGLLGGVSLALLLTLLSISPLFYFGLTYAIGPRVPVTWPPVLLSMALIAIRHTTSARRERSSSFGVVGAVLLYCWVTCVILLGNDVRGAAEEKYHNFLAAHVAFGGAFLIAGWQLPNILAALKARWAQRFVLVSAGALGLTIALATWSWNFTYKGVIPWYLLGVPKAGTYEGLNFDYLYVSDYTALSALVLYTVLRSFWSKLLLTAVTLVLLFWTGSRSTLACFAVVAVLMLYLRWKTLRLWPRILGVSIALFAGAYLMLMVAPSVQDAKGDVSLMRFDFTNITSDDSYLARKEIVEEGMARLKREWVLGHFMGEVLEGREGFYIHNWLSFWSSYGLGPFVLFVVLFGTLLVRVSIEYLRNPTRNGRELIFALAWFVGLSLVVSRSYGVQYVWLVLTGVPSVLAERGANIFVTKRKHDQDLAASS